MPIALPLVTYDKLEQQVEAMEREGFVYFSNILSLNEVEEFRQLSLELEPLSDALDTDLTLENDGHFQRCINAAFNRDPLFLKYLDKPGLIELAEAIHGPDCHIISMHTWAVGPGRPDQLLHTDWIPASMPEELRSDPRLQLPIYITTAHFYLDDMTETLGPTKIIPGSHLSGRSPDHSNVIDGEQVLETNWNGIEEHSFLGRAGDCIFFRSEIWHRGTSNTSNRIRHTFMVHYAQRMITQKFPPYIDFQYNQDVLSVASPHQLRLLGNHQPGVYD